MNHKCKTTNFPLYNTVLVNGLFVKVKCLIIVVK